MKTKHIAFAVAVFASVALVGSALYFQKRDNTPPKTEVAHVQEQKTSDPLQKLFQEEINEAQETKNEDPLKKLLGILEEKSPSEMLKADFLTPELKKFSQQKSASLQTCMQSVSTENIVKGKVNAFYGPNGDISSWQNADGTINKTKLQIELAPVFGEAVRTSALNWTYEEKYFRYTFFMPEGDESLWYCYFTQESPFFKAFFGQVSFEIDPSKIPVPTAPQTPTVQPSTPTVTPIAIVTPTPLIPTPTTPPSPTTPLPCDRTAGGAGCFGQTLDGRWWTRKEELEGKLYKSVPSGENDTLFVPSKFAYENSEDYPESTVMVITYKTSLRGYADPTIPLNQLGPWYYSGLKANVTYLVRVFPTKNIPVTKIKLVGGYALKAGFSSSDNYGNYIFAVSKDPTPIVYNGQTDPCMIIGEKGEIDGLQCPALNTGNYKSVKDQAYLKIQVAPTTTRGRVDPSCNMVEEIWEADGSGGYSNPRERKPTPLPTLDTRPPSVFAGGLKPKRVYVVRCNDPDDKSLHDYTSDVCDGTKVCNVQVSFTDK